MMWEYQLMIFKKYVEFNLRSCACNMNIHLFMYPQLIWSTFLKNSSGSISMYLTILLWPSSPPPQEFSGSLKGLKRIRGTLLQTLCGSSSMVLSVMLLESYFRHEVEFMNKNSRFPREVIQTTVLFHRSLRYILTTSRFPMSHSLKLEHLSPSISSARVHRSYGCRIVDLDSEYRAIQKYCVRKIKPFRRKYRPVISGKKHHGIVHRHTN